MHTTDDQASHHHTRGVTLAGQTHEPAVKPVTHSSRHLASDHEAARNNDVDLLMLNHVDVGYAWAGSLPWQGCAFPSHGSRPDSGRQSITPTNVGARWWPVETARCRVLVASRCP